MSRLKAEALVLFGTCDVRFITFAHQERPFSHLLRVGVCRQSAERPDLHIFIKIFKSKSIDGSVEKMRQRVQHDFDVNQRVFERMRQWTDFAVVRPIVCYVDHLAIVTEQAQGETLMNQLESRATWFSGAVKQRDVAETLDRVGRWLGAFQSTEPASGRVALTELRAYIDSRLQRLVAHEVFSTLRREQILDYLDALAVHVPATQLELVPIHGDFAPGNILVCGRRIVVLDLAMVQHGSSLHDVSRLYLQLDALRAKPHFRPGLVQTLQNALLRGFDQTLTPANPLFRYLSMLHRVNHFGTLALNAEPFLARALSYRVRRIHLRWIAQELQGSAHG